MLYEENRFKVSHKSKLFCIFVFSESVGKKYHFFVKS